MTRLELANALKDAAESYFVKRRYSCFQELSVVPWGKLRADLLALNLRSEIVLCEVKSCASDYLNDNKWHRYLEYCDKFYIVVNAATFKTLKLDLLRASRQTGAGTLVIGKDGYLHALIGAKTQTTLDLVIRHKLITRMAWRAGSSKRTRRRVRHYV